MAVPTEGDSTTQLPVMKPKGSSHRRVTMGDMRFLPSLNTRESTPDSGKKRMRKRLHRLRVISREKAFNKISIIKLKSFDGKP